jgi:ABC-type multidrug transport system fused ATPase/permease subunit
MAVTTAVAAVAGAGASAYGSYEQGKATQAADTYQANVDKTKAEYAAAAAAETNASMTDKLATTLGNIDVIRAAGHDDPTSPTTRALRSRATEVSNQERAIKVGNIYAQQSADLTDASYLQSAGDFALNMGYVSAGADVATAIGKTNPNLFGFSSGPGTGYYGNPGGTGGNLGGLY